MSKITHVLRAPTILSEVGYFSGGIIKALVVFRLHTVHFKHLTRLLYIIHMRIT